MQRKKLITIADALIKMGEEIRSELTNRPCTIYYSYGGAIESHMWSTWKTDEEIVEWCEDNKITKWWR